MNEKQLTTLQLDLMQSEERRKDRLKNDVIRWYDKHHSLFTHAVTLTFDPKKVDAFTNQFSRSVQRNDDEMLKRYQQSLKLFLNKVERKLYGNVCRRFRNVMLVVPVLEHTNKGQLAHYHISFGLHQSRHAAFEALVRKEWKNMPFAGFSVDVQTYNDEGWIGYSSKEVESLDRLSVDWSNVRELETQFKRH